MSTSRTITKVKAAVQDLQLGPGTTQQSRQGSSYTVDNIASVFLVASIDQLKSFPTEAKYAAIADDSDITEYWYDSASTATPNDSTVILPNSGLGRWLRRPTSGGGSGGDGGATIDLENTLNFYFRANLSSDDINVELELATVGDFCHAVATVKGSGSTFGFSSFPANTSYNTVNILGEASTQDPLLIPQAYRPRSGKTAKIPLIQHWTNSLGTRQEGAFLCIMDNGQVYLRNVYSGEVTLAGDLQNTDPNFTEFASSVGWWRTA